jgi:hypothetical protein
MQSQLEVTVGISYVIDPTTILNVCLLTMQPFCGDGRKQVPTGISNNCPMLFVVTGVANERNPGNASCVSEASGCNPFHKIIDERYATIGLLVFREFK